MSSEQGKDPNYQELSMEDPMPGIIQLSASILMGLFFGFAIEKGRVYEPRVIRGQMLMADFTMMKMFLSAGTTGMLVLSALTMCKSLRGRVLQAWTAWSRAAGGKSLAGVAVGGLILGSGMTLAGACPGTVAVQLGAGVENAGVTALGGLLGAILYGSVQPLLAGRATPSPMPPTRLDEVLDICYWHLALPAGLVLGALVAGLEAATPTPAIVPAASLIAYKAWPAWISGILVGTLQLPAVVMLCDTLGSVTAFMTVAANIARLPPLSFTGSCRALRDKASGIRNWWMVFYLASAILGGRVSADASGSLGIVAGVPWTQGLAGGALMVFGSQLAGGCTSGHGLSGLAFLAVPSVLAVTTMFGGGVATALVMRHALGLQLGVQ